VLDAVRGTGAWKDNGTSGGNLSSIAKRLNVTRQTVYNYKSRWKTVNDAINDEKETMLDFTENQLFKQVQAGNITAIIFTLKTLGKNRGYVERQEITGKDGTDLYRVNWDEVDGSNS
jgi:hypothetical protein